MAPGGRANVGEQARSDTREVIAILEDKRAEVMARHQAGYVIVYWQELTDQVRQMISRDARYQAIRARQVTRSALTINLWGAEPTK